MKRMIFLALLLPVIAAFNFRNARPDRQSDYEQLAIRIEEAITRHAVNGGDRNSILRVDIGKNGVVEVYLAGQQNPVFINFFRLHKTQDLPLGIGYNPGDAELRFWYSNTAVYTIRFKEDAMAKLLYEDILALIASGKDSYTPDLPMDINETVDSINRLLKKIGQNGYRFSISFSGDAVITSDEKQFFFFNIGELVSDEWAEGFDVHGVEIIPCTLRNVAPNSFIQFNTKKGTRAWLKFYHLNDTDLNELHQLFVYLRSSMVSVMYS